MKTKITRRFNYNNYTTEELKQGFIAMQTLIDLELMFTADEIDGIDDELKRRKLK